MIQQFEKIRVLVSSSGLVHWEPGGVLMTTCDIDIRYFPFDNQACQIEIGEFLVGYTCAKTRVQKHNTL